MVISTRMSFNSVMKYDIDRHVLMYMTCPDSYEYIERLLKPGAGSHSAEIQKEKLLVVVQLCFPSTFFYIYTISSDNFKKFPSVITVLFSPKPSLTSNICITQDETKTQSNICDPPCQIANLVLELCSHKN